MGLFFFSPSLSELMTFFRAEAAIALRQRLNEAVEELDGLKKKHAELEVTHEAVTKELTIAKSDRKRLTWRFVCTHHLNISFHSKPREQGPTRNPELSEGVRKRREGRARGRSTKDAGPNQRLIRQEQDAT